MAEASAHNPQPKSNDAVVPPAVATELGGLASVSRRRTLLRGIGKAGALAGAAMPLRGLATGDKPGMRLMKNGKGYLCSKSGQNSMTHASHSASATVCSGKSVSYYQTLSNWPKNALNQPCCLVGSTAHLYTKSFYSVFGGGSQATLLSLVQLRSPTDETHWVVAMLNATKMSPTFPYSTTEVKAMYLDGPSRSAALSFFRDNLEV